MNGLIRFLHCANAGDLLAGLAGIRRMCLDSNTKAIIFQQINMVGVGYNGAHHPFQDENGDPVCCSQSMFDNLRPLLLVQDYIEDFVVYSGQDIDINLNKARMETFTNQPLGSINRYLFHLCPQMTCDLSEVSLHVPPKDTDAIFKKTILINHTFRYRNQFVNYFFLKKYEEQIMFVGLEDEYNFFCNKWNLQVIHLQCSDFLGIAQTMKACKFFSGNQSALYQIAENLKIPRILEIFPLIPNVIPSGANGYDYYGQHECEYYFDKLNQ